jgi:acetyl esterase/lipase
MHNLKTLFRQSSFIALIVLTVSIHAQPYTSNRETQITAVKSTFTYGNNKDYSGQAIDLKADLYKPTLFSNNLPMVIIYHGGGYASGDRNLAVLKVFSEYLTANNISAVLPDFRQGWYESSTKPLCESVTPEKFEDAAHRAYQDNRALIRYCKANATALGIDSNKIYLMGISSGGFLVLHHLYVNDASIDADRIARLGKLDNQSNTYTNSTDVAGIISIVGGFYKNDAAHREKLSNLIVQ